MYRNLLVAMDKNKESVFKPENLLFYGITIPLGFLALYGTFCCAEELATKYIKDKSCDILCDIIKSDKINVELANYINNNGINLISEMTQSDELKMLIINHLKLIINEYINGSDFKILMNNVLLETIQSANNNANIRKETSKFLKNHFNKLLLDETIRKNLKNMIVNVLQNNEMIGLFKNVTNDTLSDANITDKLNVVCNSIISDLLDNENNLLKLSNLCSSVLNNCSIKNSAEEIISNSALKLVGLK